jgi:DNA-binding beta-propeller fold protein YncE
MISGSRVALAALLLLPSAAGCSGSSGPTVAAKSDAGSDAGAGADAGGHKKPRLAVTADWMSRSLSLLDYDEVVAGASTRDDALVGTVDLAKYAPGPIEVAVTPDGKIAVVTVGPGFFAGALGPLIGAPNVDPGGTLLLVDLETRAVVKELAAPAGPMGVVITPDGTRAFSVDHGATEGHTLSVVDLKAQKLLESVDIGGGPEEAALTPDGTLGVVNTDSNESIRFFDPKDPSGTLSAPLLIGADPGGSTFVPLAKKLVIGKSLKTNTGEPGCSVVDVSDPSKPKVVEDVALAGVPYGADVIPGTTHVLLPLGVSVCELDELDVGTSPSTIVRKITLPCAKPGLPLSTAIDPTGEHAFVGVPGDNSLMVVDLKSGDARRIPWLDQTGPMHVALSL